MNTVIVTTATASTNEQATIEKRREEINNKQLKIPVKTLLYEQRLSVPFHWDRLSLRGKRREGIRSEGEKGGGGMSKERNRHVVLAG